jgi:histidyl-tRNA synthetase
VANTFDYANRVGARYIVFVAPIEWAQGKVRVKDLRLGEECAEEDKQLDVAVADLGGVMHVLQQWALSKQMAAASVV